MVAFAVRRPIKVQLLVPGFLILLLPALSSQPADAWKGGEAAGGVSGFQIVDQVFHLDPEDPAMVDSIVFDIAGHTRPNRAWLRLSAYGTWFDCRLEPSAVAFHASAQCDVGGIPVDTLQDLRVVATGG